MNLMPQVKNFVPNGGHCQLNCLTEFQCCQLSPEERNLLSRRFPDIRIVETDTDALSCVMSDGAAAAQETADSGSVFNDRPDEYRIIIREHAVSIIAATPGGQHCALATLRQLPDVCACGVLHDFASIPLRIIHWDLKGCQPTLPVLLEELEILGDYKVNAILLELEDKYNYRCAPGVGVPGAYSFDDLRKLSRHSAGLNIRIIPKLQCLAHADYLLKHAVYAHLREDGYSFQYCATNPEAQRLWEAMAGELMECFAEHREYFHIGADEADRLGACPECSKLGKGGSYLHKVSDCMDFLAGHGRRAIIWDDILRNIHGNMSDSEARSCFELGKKAVLMYWAYGYGGRKNRFDELARYRKAGLTDVWGAAGFAGCDNWAGFLPPLAIRALNIAAWCRSSVENSLSAVCVTGWTRISSADCPAEPHETSWSVIGYSAECMWTGEGRAPADFLADFCLRFYGIVPDEIPGLEEALLNIGQQPFRFDLKRLPPDCGKRLRLLLAAALTESLEFDRKRIGNYLQYYYGRTCLTDYRLLMMRRYTAELSERIALLRKELQMLLSEFYTAGTCAEYAVSRFGYAEEQLRTFKETIVSLPEL